MHATWVASNRQWGPRAGGFQDQPAAVMAMLRLLDLKHRIWDRIALIEEKAAEEARKVAKAAKQAEDKEPDPDDSLVPVRPTKDRT